MCFLLTFENIMGCKSLPHTHAFVKPCKHIHMNTHTHRWTPRPAARWSPNRLCCQLLAFHQTKGWFLSHTQSLHSTSRPLTDPSDSSSESCYGNHSLRTDYVLPLHTDTHSLLLSNLTSPCLHLYSLSETFCSFSRQRVGNKVHAVDDSRWSSGQGQPLSGSVAQFQTL